MTQQEIIERVDAFIKKKPRKKVFFNVEPRFSAGTPAMVGFGEAVRVALHEQTLYGYEIDGVEGDEVRDRAERLGLHGIVECRREGKKAWEVLDLITGEVKERPFAQPGA